MFLVHVLSLWQCLYMCVCLFSFGKAQVDKGVPLQTCLRLFGKWIELLAEKKAVVIMDPGQDYTDDGSHNLCTFATWSGLCRACGWHMSHIHTQYSASASLLCIWSGIGRGCYCLHHKLMVLMQARRCMNVNTGPGLVGCWVSWLLTSPPWSKFPAG